MSYTALKITRLLLVILLVAAPVRATRSAGADSSTTALAHHMTTHMQMDASGDFQHCCAGNDGPMHRCEHCATCAPVALTIIVQIVPPRHQLSLTPYLGKFDTRELPPPQRPPRV